MEGDGMRGSGRRMEGLKRPHSVEVIFLSRASSDWDCLNGVRANYCSTRTDGLFLIVLGVLSHTLASCNSLFIETSAFRHSF